MSASDDLKQYTADLNKHLKAYYLKQKVKPSPIISDELFLRRVYLDIIGRIPSFKEAEAFLKSEDSDKRFQLISKLVNSEGYVNHYYNFWADLLRINHGRNTVEGVVNDEYRQWIRKSLKSNLAYDKFVYQMLTASGRAEENGAAGYYLRDQNQRLDTVATTSQVFLGTKIFCAQCHNHPFEDTSQMEYYQFASYMTSVKVNRGYGKFRQMEKRIDESSLADNQKNALRNYLRWVSVYENNGSKLRLPKDYKYKNGKAGDIVKAGVIFGDSPEEANRASFAKWLTSTDNPRFTKVIVNRLWKKNMGYGLFEPVDEYNEDTDVLDPQLLTFLENTFRKLDYDTKAFIQVLCNSIAYQRTVMRSELKMRDYKMNQGVLRRMTAEQLWDSLLTLAVGNPDLYNRPISKGPSFTEIKTVLNKEKPDNKSLMILLDKINPGAYREDMKALGLDSRRGKDMTSTSDMLNSQPESPLGRNMYRAADLDRTNYFMSLFGQSDRQIVGHGKQEATIPQTLNLLNGRLVEEISKTKRYLYIEMKKFRQRRDQVHFLYMSILTRAPRSGERRLGDKLLSKGESGFQDLVWIMTNMEEFKFIQ